MSKSKTLAALISVAADDPVRGIGHTRVSEVYYITSGSGVLVTGGTMLGRNDIPADSDIVTELAGEGFITSVASRSCESLR